ncbi:TPA: hypothetical protein EYP66_10250 [Candidatus Poribacteria bacterium]|nr:hypothetical protein [Candidatus Poribacteria bacterium]
MKDKLLTRDFDMPMKDCPDDNALWTSLASVCQNAAQRAVCTNQPKVSKAVALCFAVQKGAALKYSYAEQTKLVKNVLSVVDSQRS